MVEAFGENISYFGRDAGQGLVAVPASDWFQAAIQGVHKTVTQVSQKHSSPPIGLRTRIIVGMIDS
jgi:hypothetical protein